MSRFFLVLDQKTYAWTRELSVVAIEKRTTQKKAETFVGVLFLVLAGCSTLAFLVVGFFDGFSVFTPNRAMLLLSLGLGFGMITVAHLVQTSQKKMSMPGRAIGASIPETTTEETGTPLDVARVFDPQASELVDEAFRLARQFGHAALEPLHLFISAFPNENVGAVISRLQIDFDKIKDPLSRRLASRQLAEQTLVSESAEQTLMSSFVSAFTHDQLEVHPIEVFFQAFNHDTYIQELFFDQGVTEEQFVNMVAWVRIHEQMRQRREQFRRAAERKPTGAMNRAMTSIATPLLDAFSEDLTTAAVNGQTEMLVGREQELEDLFRVIEGGRQSVVLVGSEGVGKQTLLEGVAALMVEERVPTLLQDKRLVRISLPHLIAGVELPEAQERLLQILYEVIKSGNIVLAINDVDQLNGELANTFVDVLSRSGAFVIATTTPQGFTTSVERSMLGRVFEKVKIEEPNQNETIQILESKALMIEAEHGVSFTYLSLETIVKLTDRFLHESFLPKKAIEVAREVAQMVAKQRGENALVTSEDVEHVMATKTGIPTTRVAEDEKELLLHLEERMHSRVVGQTEAVSAIAAALRRARTQLQSQGRPIATFLFLGPTGVGKTELAKTVAESYFGSEDTMIRLDMSEYQQPESVARLIGISGSQDGGLFTEAVRQKPFALILLDEFEKADPNILNLFLQVFDDGRLTDASGRTIDFTNTILIATSNAGTSYIQEAVKRGETSDQMKTHLLEEELQGVYRPELLNRFDGVIVFTPLTQEEIVEITRRMIASVAERLEAKGMYFRASEDVIQTLAKKGYDPVFGARPLRRVVQEEVDNAIAEALLKDQVKRRDTIVLESEGIRIEHAPEL